MGTVDSVESGTSLSEPSPRLVSDIGWETSLRSEDTNSGICHYVDVLQEQEVSSRCSQGVHTSRNVTTRNVYSQLSGLVDVVFNDFINDDCIQEVNRYDMFYRHTVFRFLFRSKE